MFDSTGAGGVTVLGIEMFLMCFILLFARHVELINDLIVVIAVSVLVCFLWQDAFYQLQ